jgi:hypothetical protein
MIAFWLSQGASLARPFRDAVATRNSAETNAAAQESCSSLAPGVTDLPIERIKEVVQPTGDQLAALNELAPRLPKQTTSKRRFLRNCPKPELINVAGRADHTLVGCRSYSKLFEQFESSSFT